MVLRGRKARGEAVRGETGRVRWEEDLGGEKMRKSRIEGNGTGEGSESREAELTEERAWRRDRELGEEKRKRKSMIKGSREGKGSKRRG